MPGVVAAVGAAHRHRGALATGPPWASWLRRLRPDPLRRLGIGDAPRPEQRTSLPRATPVQRAQVDSALRTLSADAARGLDDPWPALARRATMAHETEIDDRLDRAIAGAELRVIAPRWWIPVRWLQRLLALVALAGALWLVLLAGAGWLQLGDAVPTPDFHGFPVPTALLIAGLAGGLLLGLLTRIANRIGAKRRAARARRALQERVLAVAERARHRPARGGAGRPRGARRGARHGARGRRLRTPLRAGAQASRGRSVGLGRRYAVPSCSGARSGVRGAWSWPAWPRSSPSS